MLETRAIVVRTDGQYAWVQPDQANGCEQCAGKGCGAGKLARLLCSKPRQFRVGNSINAALSDVVVISVAEGAVLRGIGLAYLLPLLLMMLGAMLGNFWFASPGLVQAEQRDAYAAMGAISGLAGGFVLAKWLSLRQTQSHLRPYIARLWREE